ncbi:PadR family transcriptional regulator [Saliphagus sp. GCM10025308]
MSNNTKHTGAILNKLANEGSMNTAAEPNTLSVERNESHQSAVERDLEEMMAQVVSVLPAEDVRFEDALLKENLDEVLLMLVALHDGANGKELLSTLATYFDVQLSPGIVYPALHDLEDEAFLEMHPMVRTKEYSISNEDHVRATLEATMVQHLAFGLLLSAFLPRLTST